MDAKTIGEIIASGTGKIPKGGANNPAASVLPKPKAVAEPLQIKGYSDAFSTPVSSGNPAAVLPKPKVVGVSLLEVK